MTNKIITIFENTFTLLEKKRFNILTLFIWIFILSAVRMWTEAVLFNYPYQELSFNYIFTQLHIISFYFTVFLGGILIINYPRIDDLLAKIFGKKWWFLLSVHMFYFTPGTLSAYMKRINFKPILHKCHIQQLSYDYLVSRLAVYSQFLAKLAKIPYIIPGFKKLFVPYFASQYLMVARKLK